MDGSPFTATAPSPSRSGRWGDLSEGTCRETSCRMDYAGNRKRLAGGGAERNAGEVFGAKPAERETAGGAGAFGNREGVVVMSNGVAEGTETASDAGAR